MGRRADSTLRGKMDRVLEAVLRFSIGHGAFGMQTVDALHEQLPRTKCAACGRCCYSISFYSLEYHRIIRYMAENFPVGRQRRLLYLALTPENRLDTTGNRLRYRCVFLDEKHGNCTIYPVRPLLCRVFGQEKPGEMDCPYVESEAPLDDRLVCTLAERIASVSESFEVPVQGKTDTIDFFPFEFWVIRAISGADSAIDWFVNSVFYEKYIQHRTLLPDR